MDRNALRSDTLTERICPQCQGTGWDYHEEWAGWEYHEGRKERCTLCRGDKKVSRETAVEYLEAQRR